MIDKLDNVPFKEGATKVTSEFRQQTLGYITGGLGVVAGLAWNDAIKALINYWFPGERDTVWAQFGYAVLITVVVVVVTMTLIRFIKKEDKKEEEKK
jgi:hypothetical protein